MHKAQHPWFKQTYYPHFDRTIGVSVAESLVSDTDKVCRHPFLPFISYSLIDRRYKPRLGKTKDKPRQISLASHKDAAIYRYYNFLLCQAYEKRVEGTEIDDCVIGYRKLNGQCNIHFADEVFREVRKRSQCVAIKVDVEQFFPSLNHVRIKKQWASILRVRRIPVDHYKVYCSITRYASVDRAQLLRALGLRQWQLRSWSGPLCSPADFRAKVRNEGKLITRNNADCGIPQGSPLSATVSNIAMLAFDEQMSSWANRKECRYRRYADDIVLIGPPEVEGEALSQLENLLAAEGLQVHPDKRDVVHFSRGSSGALIADGELEYLGFTFDGRRTLVRGRTLARYQRRMKSAVFVAARAASKGKARGGSGVIRRRPLHDRFTQRGKRNVIRYMKRSSRIMGEEGKGVLRQTRNHEQQLSRAISRNRKRFEK